MCFSGKPGNFAGSGALMDCSLRSGFRDGSGCHFQRALSTVPVLRVHFSECVFDRVFNMRSSYLVSFVPLHVLPVAFERRLVVSQGNLLYRKRSTLLRGIPNYALFELILSRIDRSGPERGCLEVTESLPPRHRKHPVF